MFLGFKRMSEPPLDEVPALSVTVTLSHNQVEKLFSIIEESERCLLEARSILSTNVTPKPSPSSNRPKTPSARAMVPRSVVSFR